MADFLTFPAELTTGLERIVAAVANDGPELCRSYEDVAQTAQSIKEALAIYGYEVSLGQAENVFGYYSHSRWASWLTGGCPTVESACAMLLDFSKDILFGENHAEL